VPPEVSQRQVLSNLIRCSRSREPIMTHDSVSLMSRVHVGTCLAGLEHRCEVSLFPTVSCWSRSGNLFRRLRSCVGMSKLLKGFRLFLATMASSQFQAARSWSSFSRSVYTSTRSEGCARHTSRHLQPALLRYCLLPTETVREHVSQVPFPLQQFALKLCSRPTQRAQPCKIVPKLSCTVLLMCQCSSAHNHSRTKQQSKLI